ALGNHGTTGDVVFWYSAYSGYFDREMLSVKRVEPMNSNVSNTAPSTVHCATVPAATAPNAKTTHHCACSKKKLGWRENRNRPVVRKRGRGSRPATCSACFH